MTLRTALQQTTNHFVAYFEVDNSVSIITDKQISGKVGKIVKIPHKGYVLDGEILVEGICYTTYYTKK